MGEKFLPHDWNCGDKRSKVNFKRQNMDASWTDVSVWHLIPFWAAIW